MYRYTRYRKCTYLQNATIFHAQCYDEGNNTIGTDGSIASGVIYAMKIIGCTESGKSMVLCYLSNELYSFMIQYDLLDIINLYDFMIHSWWWRTMPKKSRLGNIP